MSIFVILYSTVDVEGWDFVTMLLAVGGSYFDSMPVEIFISRREVTHY
ncbi:hypothetical protein [Thermococcus sp.]